MNLCVSVRKHSPFVSLYPVTLPTHLVLCEDVICFCHQVCNIKLVCYRCLCCCVDPLAERLIPEMYSTFILDSWSEQLR